MNDYPKLVDGFAYLEFKAAFTKTKDGRDLVSKKGAPMMSVQWTAVDSVGNCGVIRSYFVPTAPWAIDNLENAIGVRGLLNPVTKRFNEALLLRKSCGATIIQDDNPDYGSKIKAFLPLSFFNLLNDSKKEEGTTKPMVNLNPKTTSTPAGLDDFDPDELPF